MIEKQLQLYEELLNKKEFYKAHEALEVVWFEKRFEENNEIKLLKGFINAAVCFELIKRGKNKQSKIPWKNYLKYRTLLYKIDSPNLNRYHKTARHIEILKNTQNI